MHLKELAIKLDQFARERNWAKFHSPKNLSMALSVEAAELLEQFQWVTEEQSRVPDAKKLNRIAAEIADIQIYLVMIAAKLDIDIEKAVRTKIAANAEKHPVGQTPLWEK